MLSREQPQAPLRYPEPSRVRSPTLLSERLCRLEERREPCPCQRENHKFSDLWRPKMHVVQYFIRLSRRSAVAMSVADFSSQSLPAYKPSGPLRSTPRPMTRGPDEPSAVQALGVQLQADAIVPKNLDDIAPTPA